jgi:hypothetical protein
MGSIAKMFQGSANRGGSGSSSSLTSEISAMCCLKDLLAIGFANGVLIVLDTDKLEITFSHKHFTKNDKPIDKLRVFNCGDAFSSASAPDSLTILYSLSDGLLSYHHFPKITLIDELILEANTILDFQPYSQPSSTSRRSFLATVHKTKELKIFRLRKKGLEY